MATINPYLSFDGTCKQAFDFYKSVFGGEFATLMKFGEVPKEFQPPGQTPAEGEKLMHVALPIGKTAMLMGSDRPGAFGPGKKGDMFNVAIAAESKAEAEKLFNGLSAGGQVTMPMSDAFWGAYFGMFTDKFGVQWMVNFDPKAPGR
ncbi:MAG TPA: VOC family protein [Fibrobacteria bacterium]|nr:VOC family protein [Fibrobacteria bacterium]